MMLHTLVNEARVWGMTQIDNLVYYDSNSDKDDEDDTFHNSIQGEVGEDFDGETNDTAHEVYGKSINNEFLYPVDQHKRVTGMMVKQDRIADI